MSTKLFKFKPLLVCVVIGILTGLISKFIFNSTSLITVFSGLLAFCLSTVMYIYFKQVLVVKKLVGLHQGIMSYEKQINERLHDLTNSSLSIHEFDHLKQELENLREEISTSTAAQNIASSTQYIDESTPSADTAESASSDDNKVVELHPKKNAPNESKSELKLDMSDETAVKQALMEGIKIQLQPAITLNNKQVFSFDALPCLLDEEHGFINCTDLKSTFSNEKQHRIINQLTLEQTINLVRRLRRQNKSPLVFVELSASTLHNKKAFDNFADVLKAHHQVKNNIIVEIPQFDFLTLTKSGLAKLRLILDLGYTLSMSNCTDVDAVVATLKQNLFSHIKLTANTIEELSIDQNNSKELEILSLCRQANTNLMVTGVEKDYQVIQLIDNHVAIAAGNFFSTPKFPSQSDSEKAAAVKK